ncbi:hypothetical protein HPP92_020804 [Vanilla planifolia]|uniref:Uncharacterized protein n=1 Tax=Vanilla planifolia TaxID=51239 RepID=A0A835Q0D2_VANPL|nr:hypothetical protein HPP92_020804 [Vanilla planifolia]
MPEPNIEDDNKRNQVGIKDASGTIDEMVPYVRAAHDARGAVQDRSEDPERFPDSANHSPPFTPWEDRGEECVLLVSESQGQRQTEA